MGKHDSPVDHNDTESIDDNNAIYNQLRKEHTAPRALVVVASTRAAHGIYEDESGKTLVTWLESRGFIVSAPVIVADADIPQYFAQLFHNRNDLPQVVLTTGGTGLSTDDVTVDELEKYLDTQLPGIVMRFWQIGLRSTPLAVCSRAIAGTVAQTFVMALPGSVGGCHDGITTLDPIIGSIVGMLEGTHVH
ncbi:MAG: MogA/MoaB family molybdenum cofactor biosynthesis protein [Corynebacterium sp.]|nr:MogA/MoaB family molybdenum cofactor biosynthesis protein [Corynebacterium sp.]